MAQVTLAYTAKPGIPALLARVTAKMGSARIFFGELDLLGMSVASDVTVQGVDSATRTIVLNVLATGEQQFPTVDEKRSATVGLYSGTLSALIPGCVASALPVVS